MRVFLLMDRASSEAVDVYVRRQDADDALAEVLRDEPTWEGDLSIVAIELDERRVSAN